MKRFKKLFEEGKKMLPFIIFSSEIKPFPRSCLGSVKAMHIIKNDINTDSPARNMVEFNYYCLSQGADGRLNLTYPSQQHEIRS